MTFRNIFKNTNRLPSNLRPTTRECMHLITRGHFRSRDKEGRDTIRFAVAENLMIDANLLSLCFLEPEWGRSKFYVAGIEIFDVFAPVTLTLTR